MTYIYGSWFWLFHTLFLFGLPESDLFFLTDTSPSRFLAWYTALNLIPSSAAISLYGSPSSIRALISTSILLLWRL